MMKDAKEELIEEQCIIINKEMTASSSKKAYSTLDQDPLEDQSAQGQCQSKLSLFHLERVVVSAGRYTNFRCQ
ncbi:hypothetical protein DPMN_025278 [Dreissena polymorpha]|uniref:Uncharacterized protein n=1 Tax=Dreissena polymorpha TaxID=45954 RepID=A0A9D4LP12_DREPO|nr:hypothetical protein DPMN_025278 [Dreissena polymorpha]